MELEFKANKLIYKIALSQSSKYNKIVNNLNKNYINEEEKEDEDEDEYEEDDENFFSDDEIVEENEKDKNNAKIDELVFPFDFDSNPNYFFPNIEDDELNPFKDFHNYNLLEYITN